jgi:hypothetical protein
MSMRSRWVVADPVLVGLCACAGLVFGASWGSVAWIFFPNWGLEVGLVLGTVVAVGLYMRAMVYAPETDDWDE